MAILSRIHAHGGEIIRDEWRFSLRPGRLSPEAVTWLRAHWAEARLEAWPEFDRWAERAAIREFDGGATRADAERDAYAEVMGC